MADTIRIMYNGKGETVQNRFGIFPTGEIKEIPRTVGKEILKYQGFQEEVQTEKEEKPKVKKNIEG
ncbi:MAG: hypothetical protein WC623_24435 [Pedobacter sp.]|uniref:hypothetical protein n=1 Tax=Pedobacter sp. TaxID=1411316 RepID=UPI003566150C